MAGFQKHSCAIHAPMSEWVVSKKVVYEREATRRPSPVLECRLHRRRHKGTTMVSSNSIQRGDPQLKEVLLGFLDSASSLCNMMNTTMAAVLNEIMSIQANEACGAEGATRFESRMNSRCGYRDRGRDAPADGAQAVQWLVLPDRPLQALHRAPSARWLRCISLPPSRARSRRWTPCPRISSCACARW